MLGVRPLAAGELSVVGIGACVGSECFGAFCSEAVRRNFRNG
jgi:hypothetical protein